MASSCHFCTANGANYTRNPAFPSPRPSQTRRVMFSDSFCSRHGMSKPCWHCPPLDMEGGGPGLLCDRGMCGPGGCKRCTVVAPAVPGDEDPVVNTPSPTDSEARRPGQQEKGHVSHMLAELRAGRTRTSTDRMKPSQILSKYNMLVKHFEVQIQSTFQST